MVTEDFVSYETAKLLKEKGFDWCESPFYSEQDRDEWWQNNSYTVPNEEYDPDLPFDSETLTLVAPHVSIQMAMKWLREKHNKIIVPGISLDDRTSSTINHYNVGIWYIPKNNGGAFCYTSPTPYNGYPSFEEACEAGIKYCLENLI